MNTYRNKQNEYKVKHLEISVENLAKAVFVVNKHAKTATKPKFLYALKKKTLEKLIQDGKAKKIGLQFSKNPKLLRQTSSVLITCGSYHFHLPPIKEDFKNLPHLGHQKEHLRNPKTHLSLKQAKALLIEYTGLKQPQPTNPYVRKSKQFISPYAKRYGER